MANRDPESENAVTPKTRDDFIAILQRSVEEERAARRAMIPAQSTSSVVKGMIGMPGSQFQTLPEAEDPVASDELDEPGETFALSIWHLGAPATLNVYADGPPIS